MIYSYGNTVEISHDAFARASIMRRIVYMSKPASCAWCGNFRGKNQRTLFQYGTENDGRMGRVYWREKLFCSKPCHDTYYR